MEKNHKKKKKMMEIKFVDFRPNGVSVLCETWGQDGASRPSRPIRAACGGLFSARDYEDRYRRAKDVTRDRRDNRRRPWFYNRVLLCAPGTWVQVKRDGVPEDSVRDDRRRPRGIRIPRKLRMSTWWWGVGQRRSQSRNRGRVTIPKRTRRRLATLRCTCVRVFRAHRRRRRWT